MKLITQAVVAVTLALLTSVITCMRTEIFVKVLSGVTMKFQVESSDTVAHLKEKIQARTGVPREVQRLVFETDMLGAQNLFRLGLRPGSTVFLVLFSWNIKDIEGLNRALSTAASNKIDPPRAPIFREASRDSDLSDSLDVAISHSEIYKDTQNWIFTSLVDWRVINLFDPTSRLELSLEEKLWLIEDEQLLEDLGPRANVNMCTHLLRRMRNSMANFMRQRRSRTWRSERHGIRLGTIWPQGERLDVNINNYAPASFTDQEIVRLFGVSEKVREQLESDAIAGKNKLGLVRQKEINQEVHLQYASALAGYEPAVDMAQPGVDETCGICMDNLSEESACKLTCDHSFHTDCLHQWAQNLNRESIAIKLKSKTIKERGPNCPYCRKPFRGYFLDVIYDSLNLV